MAEEAESDNEVKNKLIKEFNESIASLNGPELSNLLKSIDFVLCDKLLNRICDGIVHCVRDKSPEQIREKWNLKNDLTEEDVAEIKKKHGYLLISKYK